MVYFIKKNSKQIDNIQIYNNFIKLRMAHRLIFFKL